MTNATELPLLYHVRAYNQAHLPLEAFQISHPRKARNAAVTAVRILVNIIHIPGILELRLLEHSCEPIPS